MTMHSTSVAVNTATVATTQEAPEKSVPADPEQISTSSSINRAMVVATTEASGHLADPGHTSVVDVDDADDGKGKVEGEDKEKKETEMQENARQWSYFTYPHLLHSA